MAARRNAEVEPYGKVAKGLPSHQVSLVSLRVLQPRRTAGPVKTGSGSGFGVSQDGYIVTNYHVVAGCNTIQIAEGFTRTLAPVVAADKSNDLALLKADRVFESAAHISSIPLRLGEPVWAAGFPLNGILAPSINVTPGAVSSEAGISNTTTRVQITAPIQPGNSGGPLLTKNGSVAGVVVQSLSSVQVALALGGKIPQNVNFAIKASVLRDFLDSSHVYYTLAAPGEGPALDPTVLAEQARTFTVALECWK